MNNLLRMNPEFARNVWLELSLQRLIIMPVVIVLIMALIGMNVGTGAYSPMHYTALGLFAFITMIWGMKAAIDSVIEEYNDKTWDWQRMSIIGPAKLVWGKLFGSTVYQWYGGAICMFFYIITSFSFDDPGHELKMAFVMILNAIMIQGLMILLSLLLVRKGDGRSKIRSTRIFIIGLVIISTVLKPYSWDWGRSMFGSIDMAWYGIHGGLNIALITVLFYGSWVIAGLHRSMRAELQYSDKPNYWVIFLLTNIFFVFGYISGYEVGTTAKIAITLAFCFSQMLMILYFLALTEPKDIVNFRLLLESWRNRNMDSFYRNVPLWPVTLVITLITGAVAVMFSLAAISTMPVNESNNNFTFSFQNSIARWITEYGSLKIIMLYVAIVCFVVRDLGILLLLNFSRRANRADGAMIIYFAILYMLLPALTFKFGVGAAFYPDLKADAFVMAALPLVEAIVTTLFLRARWMEMQENAVLA